MNVETAARELLGTPFHWGGRVPGVGMDCAGVIVHSAHAAGLNLEDWRGYGDHPTSEHLIERFTTQASEIPIEEAKPGDVMLFCVKRRDRPLHMGILTEKETVIHTHTTIKQVIEEPLEKWRGRIWGVYRMKGDGEEEVA